GWYAENAAITGSDMTFERVMFTSRTLAALCKMSIELFEDGQGIDQVVSRSLAAALALELDRAALFGDGTGAMPTGVYNYANVQSLAAGGPLSSYAKIITALQKIHEANGAANAMIHSPRTWGVLEALADTTGNPLRPPASVEQLQRLVSKQVPINVGA